MNSYLPDVRDESAGGRVHPGELESVLRSSTMAMPATVVVSGAATLALPPDWGGREISHGRAVCYLTSGRSSFLALVSVQAFSA
jgi:hypothetical protein